MAIRIEFGQKKPDLAEHNSEEVQNMQTCIDMIKSGKGEEAISILQGLIQGESKETEEGSEEEATPEAKGKPSLREELAKKMY